MKGTKSELKLESFDLLVVLTEFSIIPDDFAATIAHQVDWTDKLSNLERYFVE